MSDPAPTPAPQPPPRPPRRWGVRTLAFLALAAASVIASNVLPANDVEGYALLPFLGLVAGLAGAAWCTVRGLRDLRSRREW